MIQNKLHRLRNLYKFNKLQLNSIYRNGNNRGLDEQLRNMKNAKMQQKQQQQSQQNNNNNSNILLKIVIGSILGVGIGQGVRQYFQQNNQNSNTNDNNSQNQISPEQQKADYENLQKQYSEQKNTLTYDQRLDFIINNIEKNIAQPSIYQNSKEQLQEILNEIQSKINENNKKDYSFIQDKINLTLGNCLINLGEYKEALQIYEKVQAYQEGVFYKAICLQEMNQKKDGALILEDLVENYDKYSQKHIPKGYILESLAEIYKQINQFQLALDTYDTLISIDIENAQRNLRFYINKAYLFYTLEAYAESVDCCEKIIEIDPDNAQAKDLQKKISQKAQKLLSQ